jgi:putative ABC transport system ATP-binding protein
MDIDELLEVLGLTEHQNKFPSQLSGGQQQRCAIARALIKNPKLLLCDEPTGALDTSNTKEIMKLLREINKKYGTTILIVTHNELICSISDRIIGISDGRIVRDEKVDLPADPDSVQWA